RVDVVKLAVPPLSVAVPRVLEPSMNVAVPVGVPPPGETGLTVAVKVTAWPATDGLREETTLVVVLACLTVWVRAAEVLVMKLLSPLYTPVIEFEPTESVEMVNLAVP